MGAWRRLHTRAEEGRLLIVYQLLVEPSRAAGFFRYPCWTGSGPEASGDDCDEECCDGSAAVTTPAHALPCLRATKANCSRRIPQPIHCYSLEKQSPSELRFAAHPRRAKETACAALRSCKHSKFLRQLQQSCRVPGLRTRVPQRRRITANNPTKLTHDDARRPPHVQRDEAAHASRSA